MFWGSLMLMLLIDVALLTTWIIIIMFFVLYRQSNYLQQILLRVNLIYKQIFFPIEEFRPHIGQENGSDLKKMMDLIISMMLFYADIHYLSLLKNSKMTQFKRISIQTYKLVKSKLYNKLL